MLLAWRSRGKAKYSAAETPSVGDPDPADDADEAETLVDELAQARSEDIPHHVLAMDADALRHRIATAEDVMVVHESLRALTVQVDVGPTPHDERTTEALMTALTRHDNERLAVAAVSYCHQVSQVVPERVDEYTRPLAVVLAHDQPPVLSDLSTDAHHGSLRTIIRTLNTAAEVDASAVVPCISGLAHYLDAWPSQRSLLGWIVQLFEQVAIPDTETIQSRPAHRPFYRWGVVTGHATAFAPHVQTLASVTDIWDEVCRGALTVLYAVTRASPAAIEPALPTVIDTWHAAHSDRRSWIWLYGILSVALDETPALFDGHVDRIVDGIARDVARLYAPPLVSRERLTRARAALPGQMAVLVALSAVFPASTARAMRETRLAEVLRGVDGAIDDLTPMLVQPLSNSEHRACHVQFLELLHSIATRYPAAIESHTDVLQPLATDGSPDVSQAARRLLAAAGLN